MNSHSLQRLVGMAVGRRFAVAPRARVQRFVEPRVATNANPPATTRHETILIERRRGPLGMLLPRELPRSTGPSVTQHVAAHTYLKYQQQGFNHNRVEPREHLSREPAAGRGGTSVSRIWRTVERNRTLVYTRTNLEPIRLEQPKCSQTNGGRTLVTRAAAQRKRRLTMQRSVSQLWSPAGPGRAPCV